MRKPEERSYLETNCFPFQKCHRSTVERKRSKLRFKLFVRSKKISSFIFNVVSLVCFFCLNKKFMWNDYNFFYFHKSDICKNNIRLWSFYIKEKNIWCTYLTMKSPFRVQLMTKPQFLYHDPWNDLNFHLPFLIVSSLENN